MLFSEIADRCGFFIDTVQNATLAGGVAIGSIADMIIGPWVGMVIGYIGGIITVAGPNYLSVSLLLLYIIFIYYLYIGIYNSLHCKN